MFQELKDNWLPSANIFSLKKRATLITKIRRFFLERNILEIDVPCLSRAAATDPYIQSIKATLSAAQQIQETFYLHTSPEFSMKRLLAAGMPSIYFMGKAFRDDEIGRYHNPEFTMLEWYRLDWDEHQLMEEVAALLRVTLDCETTEKFTYAEIFEKYLGLNIFSVTANDLKSYALKKNVEINVELDKDGWLQLLMSHFIEPSLGKNNIPTFIYSFPATQAALAKIDENDKNVARRFEVYVSGIELANGFYELTDFDEQRQRFMRDLETRKKEQLPKVPQDENFLAALEAGLPGCSGVALGVDRLCMLALGLNSIQEVMSFDYSRV